MTRWLRITIGGWLVRAGVALLPKEREVEEALYRWVTSDAQLHRRMQMAPHKEAPAGALQPVQAVATSKALIGDSK